MHSLRRLVIYIVTMLTVHVVADSGDDFSNNLLSDLSPLLALFGERVTMQFMSQSMGWTDNIILAMAPLGIITIIVSAIRVGGPTWLKAVVGRARENLAVAEADIMSSTSNEVCELWNGREVVRCMGSAPIREFIVLFNSPSDQTTDPPKVTVLDFNNAKKYLQPPESKQQGGFCWRRALRINHDDPETGSNKDTSKYEVIVTRNMPSDQSDNAPNITLNSHDPIQKLELRIVAVLGVILQLGALVYSGCATYYPTLKFLKDGSPVARYAFPCTGIGTILLSIGILLCGHIVETSTTESRYEIDADKSVRLVWLQQRKTVSDQVFDSSAIFPKNARTVITTSVRTKQKLEFKTIIGTSISLCGFILQFIGLRGMHWSASIAQLGIVLIMTAMRVWIRRKLAVPPQGEPLDCGFELEWFALTLGDMQHAPWSKTSGGDASVQRQWKIATNDSSEYYEKLERTEQNYESETNQSEAHKVMIIRRDIGELASWPGPASAEAIALTRAIEITLDVLLGNLPSDISFTWSLRCHYPRDQDQSPTQKVDFRIEKKSGAWKAHADEIEAALSLWLYCVNEQEQDQGEEKEYQEVRLGRDDKWLRAKGSSAKPNIRLLGKNTEELRRDLLWWAPNSTTSITKIKTWKEKGDKSKMRIQDFENDGDMAMILKKQQDAQNWGVKELEIPKHRIVGHGYGIDVENLARDEETDDEEPDDEGLCDEETDGGEINDDATNGEATDSESTDGETIDDEIDDTEGDNEILATRSNVSLKLLYAQDMFTAFMCSVAKELEKPIDGGSNIQFRDSTDIDAWKSFTLRNEQLSRLARDICNTGLGSLDQVYMSIIPPLSREKKLPETDKIVELARRCAEPHEQVQQWKQAGNAYLWLFSVAMSFPGQKSINQKATSVLMEFLRILTKAIDLREELRWRDPDEDMDIRALKKLREKIIGELKTADKKIQSTLIHLYKQQMRDWDYEPFNDSEDGSSESEEDTEQGDICNWTPVHDFIMKDEYIDCSDYKKQINLPDILSWTPLHYAAAMGKEEGAKRLVENGADINVRDLLGWTPLHYACQGGHISIIRDLIRVGSSLDLRGRNGVAPLHCAAMEGRGDVVRLFKEAGAVLDIRDASGSTPLHWATYRGYKSIIEELWQEANKELRDHNGRTVLHLAAIAGKADIVNLLVTRFGANKEAKDRYNRTPLHWAAGHGEKEVTDLLIELGAKVDARTLSEQTPLLWAIANKHSDVARSLIEANADIEAKNDRDERPLHYAAYYNQLDIVKYLTVEHMPPADTTVKQIDGHTPQELARLRRYMAVVTFFQDLPKKEIENNIGQDSTDSPNDAEQ